MEKLIQIRTKDIEDLLKYFGKNTYRARESCATTDVILTKCLELWKLDYKCMVVPNGGGELCNSYPNNLIIPECEVAPEGLEPPELCPLTLTSPSPLSLGSPSIIPGGSAPSFSSVVSGGARASLSINGHPASASPSVRKASLPDGSKSVVDGTTEAQSDGIKLREFILKAKFARCRARFPVPTILYKGNYICRSATLSGGPEMYGRSGIEYLFATAASNKADEDDDEDEVTQTNSDWQLFDRVRSQDIRLLRACNVGVIVDLMVEKKKVKFGMYVTSSEKVDKENRYSDFSILSLPYPGCEFFKDFRDLGYTGEGLYFNWSQPFVDAQLVIPERTMSAKVTSDWNSYRKWDLLRLSQNYLKLLLTYSHEGSQGILVHCISGWDRTPLFISLLRLSLWADGLIHSSLDHAQILYLTIAYDWMVFGHDLQDRLSKGEEIFFFCFYFLKYITSDDFSVGRKRHLSNDSSSSERLDCCVLLDADGLSSAGSSNSLNSSCSSNRSSHHAPPVYFKAGKSGESSDSYNAHLTWPYGSFTGELDFDDMSPNLSRTSSTSTPNRGSFGRPCYRDADMSGATSDGKLSVRHGTVAGNLSRTSSGSLKNGSSHASLLDASKPVICSHRSRNGHSDSSGESVAGSDHGSWGNGCQEPPHASTSPMAVPVPRGRPAPRTRQESVSSVGSWQLISGTGSLRGSTGSGGNPGSANSRSSRTSVPSSDLVDSATTIKEEEGSLESEQSIIVFNRAERLAKVRSLFYNIYVTTIGFNFSNGRNESGLGTLVSNFAQKVGIKPMSCRNTQ
ncbi:myotubularin-related protein 14-like isoform X2 [Homarus americanus]|uniref:myotubularin-related protein 14-like isoform X2 n=1 Tax=Homarus americanus TaxID=6706 RepID=UPI001C43E3C4|nr:myotubularin-related protein 14-like isoform X2 [Homarus americanus]